MRELHNEQFKAAGCVRGYPCRYYDWRGGHFCNVPQSPDFEAMKEAYIKIGQLITLCERKEFRGKVFIRPSTE